MLLAGFAALMVGLSIENGPPPLTNPPANIAPSLDESYIPLAVLPQDVMWYGIRVPALDRAVVWQRDGQGAWQTDAGIPIELAIGEPGAQVISEFRLRQVVQFGPEQNLSQYGLTLTPQYVVSFGINAYNSNNEITVDTFRLYIGSLTASATEYYVVFVEETPLGTSRQGEWVYAIPSGYIDILVDVMLNQSLSEVPETVSTMTAEPEP